MPDLAWFYALCRLSNTISSEARTRIDPFPSLYIFLIRGISGWGEFDCFSFLVIQSGAIRCRCQIVTCTRKVEQCGGGEFYFPVFLSFKGDGRPSKITVENWKIAFLRIDRVKILRKHERWIIPQLSVLDFPINPFSNLLFADRRTCRCPNQISWTDYIRMDGLNESIRCVFLLFLPRMRLWIWDLSIKTTLDNLIRRILL